MDSGGMNKISGDAGRPTRRRDYVVALAGNPNVGKSTIFNRLTGLRQHTGNWPGKTVTRAEGSFDFDSQHFRVIDLPGTYSLLATSSDEEIARDFILFERPDVTVIIVDSTRLERNLNLVLQILEITSKVVVCINLIDEARRKGIVVNRNILNAELGVPVVFTSARTGEGIPNLLSQISEVANIERIDKTFQFNPRSIPVKNALDVLVQKIQEIAPNLPNARWIALRLLEGDQSVIQGLRNGKLS